MSLNVSRHWPVGVDFTAQLLGGQLVSHPNHIVAKHGKTTHVITVVVRIDKIFHRQVGDLLDGGGYFVGIGRWRIDDDYPFIADNEHRVVQAVRDPAGTTTIAAHLVAFGANDRDFNGFFCRRRSSGIKWSGRFD